MKTRLSFALAALLLAAPATALAQGGPPSQEELKKSRDAKYEAAWFKANPWTADYDQARGKAKEEGKLIFAYFLPSFFN